MTEAKRKWPFPGDSPIVRARKTALAYRQLAIANEKQRHHMVELIRRVDPRIVAWIEDDDFKRMYKAIHDDRLSFDDELGVSDTVADLDQRIYEWGEDWHAEIEMDYGPEDMVDVHIAAKIVGVARATIGRARLRGRLEGTLSKIPGDPGGGTWLYKVADLHALSTERRTRGSRDDGQTDRVQSSGSSDPE
ncbi:MAG: hypothetical protein ABWX96_17635 [Propionibacteriaceae bacterium]